MENYFLEMIKETDEISMDNLYRTNGGVYLELHDNHTAWQVNPVSQFFYDYILFEKINEFKEKTGQDIYLLGRSGRHVCIEMNMDNIKNFKKYQKLALKLEQDFINEINKSGKETK
ncbi:MAG: hypothetical protein K9K32_00050 [Halanaerobiales bacterium]|nr:hypothetical protein [Halanaerobiales bacterium]